MRIDLNRLPELGRRLFRIFQFIVHQAEEMVSLSVTRIQLSRSLKTIRRVSPTFHSLTDNPQIVVRIQPIFLQLDGAPLIPFTFFEIPLGLFELT